MFAEILPNMSTLLRLAILVCNTQITWSHAGSPHLRGNWHVGSWLCARLLVPLQPPVFSTQRVPNGKSPDMLKRFKCTLFLYILPNTYVQTQQGTWCRMLTCFVIFFLQIRDIARIVGQPADHLLRAGTNTHRFFKMIEQSDNPTWRLKVFLSSASYFCLQIGQVAERMKYLTLYILL